MECDGASQGNTLTDRHFAVNAPFPFPGIYEGTLPPDHPGSRSAAFAQALHENGIRALRFPGGMEGQRYLPGRRRQTVRLNRRLQRMSGDAAVDWPRGHVPDWRDVCAFSKRAGVPLIFSLNTCFWVDESGAVRAVNDNRLAKQAGLADGRDHAAEAATALDRMFDQGVFQPGDVSYWEIGNEDFSLMTAEQYAAVANAFAGVLSRRDPKRSVCFTGGTWRDELVPRLLAGRTSGFFTGITSHYPYSRWPGPNPSIATADYDSLARTNVGFAGALATFDRARREGRLPNGLRVCVSETGVYKYWRYDPFRATCSFAHALAFAANWPELVSQPGVEMAVYHSLESTFFGLLMYHVAFDRLSRQFEWLPPQGGGRGSPRDHEDYARQRVRFAHQYVAMPTARVLGLLSRFRGARATRVVVHPRGLLAGALAGHDPGRDLLFVCNRGALPVRLRFAWPNPWALPGRGTWRMVESDSVYAALPAEYRVRERAAPLPRQGVVETVLPALSVNLFPWGE